MALSHGWSLEQIEHDFHILPQKKLFLSMYSYCHSFVIVVAVRAGTNMSLVVKFWRFSFRLEMWIRSMFSFFVTKFFRHSKLLKQVKIITSHLCITIYMKILSFCDALPWDDIKVSIRVDCCSGFDVIHWLLWNTVVSQSSVILIR